MGFSVEKGVAVEIENVKGKIITIVVETFYTCTYTYDRSNRFDDLRRPAIQQNYLNWDGPSTRVKSGRLLS